MIFLLGVIVMIDIWLDRSKAGNTFSSRFRALGKAWPPARILLSAVIGGLLTHWWWTPQDVYDSSGRRCPTSAGPAGVQGTSPPPDSGP
jgi:hypothetical protein